VSRGKRGSDEPVLLRDSIDAVGRGLGMPPADAFAQLAAAWPEVVGPLLAPHAEVRSVRGGVCTVEVDGSGWATQLRYAEQQLLERAAACCGAGVVTSIRVVVGGR
jgi:predicted nucleic acid-binding Zn ribbon protein